MIHTLLSWSHGSWLPWIYLVAATHVTNIGVSVYYHRALAHGGLEVSPILAVPMRIWVWMNTTMNAKAWVAVHRKHHAYTEREGDPHSPKIFGIRAVALTGWLLYARATKDTAMIEKYGKGTPNDWLENKVLAPYSWYAPALLLAMNCALFGWGLGFAFTVVQLTWMPICGDVINGLGHYIGYRNTPTRDWSTNIVPWAFVIAGEELHNNHHANPRSPNFRMRWFELDAGWIYIRLFQALGLAKVTYRARTVDAAGLQAAHTDETADIAAAY